MFRPATGFKANYHYLTLMVASDFDEWRVLLSGPGVFIQGCRQFTEAKAKEHARVAAVSYVHEIKHEDLPQIENLEWQPFTHGEFLNWRP